MSELPTDLYRCNQVQALDKAAIEIQKVAGFDLMQAAGAVCFELLQRRWPDAKHITVLCGGGNNGGDGYIVAALALQAKLSVQVYSLYEPQDLCGSARLAFELAESYGVAISSFVQGQSLFEGVVVDAILGIGLKGDVREPSATLIDALNDAELPVLAVDIPSGICGDTGRVLGCAVKADATVTFIGAKQGLFTGAASDYCGDISFSSLGVSDEVYATQIRNCERIEFTPPLLAQRPINSHKGLFGRVLVVAGDNGYGGAGIMAAESALMSGAGLVSLATRPTTVSAALARRPELMVAGIESSDPLARLVAQSEVLIIGPGLGQSEWSKMMLESALASKHTSVIDADGLNGLAEEFNYLAPRQNWVLTPHPAEAARLLGVTTAEVQEDRFAAAQQLQERYGGVIVLKGAGTIIADRAGLALCSAGNPGMSTPGMGDVLSGIIGGLLAQGIAPSDAAKLGVWAHATAADQSLHNKHLLATEIYPSLRALW